MVSSAAPKVTDTMAEQGVSEQQHPQPKDEPQRPQPAEEHQEQEQQIKQPQGDLQHPRGPSVSISSDGGPRVNGTGAEDSNSRSLSSGTAQAATAAAAETAVATKREGQRKKGNTWLDIFSFGRWRSSSNRQQGAIQLAQAFGAPNQPGRPVRMKRLYVLLSCATIAFPRSSHSACFSFISRSSSAAGDS